MNEGQKSHDHLYRSIKYSTLFHDKNIQGTRSRKKLPQHDKGHIRKVHNEHHIQ